MGPRYSNHFVARLHVRELFPSAPVVLLISQLATALQGGHIALLALQWWRICTNSINVDDIGVQRVWHEQSGCVRSLQLSSACSVNGHRCDNDASTSQMCTETITSVLQVSWVVMGRVTLEGCLTDQEVPTELKRLLSHATALQGCMVFYECSFVLLLWLSPRTIERPPAVHRRAQCEIVAVAHLRHRVHVLTCFTDKCLPSSSPSPSHQRHRRILASCRRSDTGSPS
jgi:hypothetical protein